MELTLEEQEIIRRYRGLSESQKRTVLASENSFLNWIKEVALWIWERIVDWEVHEIITGIFHFLSEQFFRY